MVSVVAQYGTNVDVAFREAVERAVSEVTNDLERSPLTESELRDALYADNSREAVAQLVSGAYRRWQKAKQDAEAADEGDDQTDQSRAAAAKDATGDRTGAGATSETTKDGDTWAMGAAIFFFIVGILAFAGASVMLVVGYIGQIFGSLHGLREWGWWFAAAIIPTVFAFLVFAGIDSHFKSVRRAAWRAELRVGEAVAWADYLDQLATAVFSRAASIINASFTQLSHDQTLRVKRAPGLGELYDQIYRIETHVTARLLNELQQLPGGTIGISGPRGAGKTMLIRKYCPEDPPQNGFGRDLSVMFAAPVEYVPREFLIHVFAILCQTYLAFCQADAPVNGSSRRTTAVIPGLQWWRHRVHRRASARTTPAERGRYVHLASTWWRSLRFQQTLTTTLSGEATVGLAKASWQNGISEQEQPLSYPQLVEGFRNFVRTIAAEIREAGGRVVIGIDELDKISSAEQAQRFVNELKIIFGIPHCYYLVSVSTEAQRTFELRAMTMRDAFDSAFDLILNVGYLSLDESRKFLSKRVIGLAEPFVCLCHCLSGGLPRDLIRICRRVIAIGNELDGDPTLTRICHRLLEEDIRAKAEAMQPVFAERYRGPEGVRLLNLIGDLTGREMFTSRLRTLCKELTNVVARLPDTYGAQSGPGLAEFLGHLYHCLSTLEFFTEGLTEEHLNNAVRNGSLDHLAGARQKLAVDVRDAWLALNAFRTDQVLESISYPEPRTVADDNAAARYKSDLTDISPA